MFAEAPVVYPTCSEISSRSALRGKRNSQIAFDINHMIDTNAKQSWTLDL